ncbi:hypothetical protein ANN_00116 [Periplaneta americana]|uniref:Uncharacterized protein n=1 Tax=Periplaneta americana TaxID=6978 RepID=A0ABQ8TTV1_PERAM|nr:hypothetical protein ANN_00116 [Periplaneta americana]
MAGLCEGGNEPPGSLKAKCPLSLHRTVFSSFMREGVAVGLLKHGWLASTASVWGKVKVGPARTFQVESAELSCLRQVQGHVVMSPPSLLPAEVPV